MSILSSISFGMFYIDIVMMLRESILVNGILTNSEIWYNMKEEHYKALETADEDLMRQIFKAHSKTAIELLYLETGKLPLRFIISKRRLMYFWQLLRTKENELIRKVYNIQKIKETKGDWYELIVKEKQKYAIEQTDEEIVKMSKNRFKTLIEKKINVVALEFLKKKALKHSKSRRILHELENKDWRKRKSYLKENHLHRDSIQLLFKLRTKMLDVKTNYANLYNGDLICRTCRQANTVEDEAHLLVCESLNGELDDNGIRFEDVFEGIEKQVAAVKAFKAVLRKREVVNKYHEDRDK